MRNSGDDHLSEHGALAVNCQGQAELNFLDLPVISDLTLRTLQSSLQGLDARRKAAENNIANVETPGFTAQKVSFEDSLRSAIARNNPMGADIEASASTAASRLNGNNVNVADELTGLTETALRQQLVVQALNSKYSVLRTAIGN